MARTAHTGNFLRVCAGVPCGCAAGAARSLPLCVVMACALSRRGNCCRRQLLAPRDLLLSREVFLAFSLLKLSSLLWRQGHQATGRVAVSVSSLAGARRTGSFLANHALRGSRVGCGWACQRATTRWRRLEAAAAAAVHLATATAAQPQAFSVRLSLHGTGSCLGFHSTRSRFLSKLGYACLRRLLFRCCGEQPASGVAEAMAFPQLLLIREHLALAAWCTATVPAFASAATAVHIFALGTGATKLGACRCVSHGERLRSSLLQAVSQFRAPHIASTTAWILSLFLLDKATYRPTAAGCSRCAAHAWSCLPAAAAAALLEGRCAPSRSMNPSIKRCTFKTYTSFPPLVPSSIINIETWKLLRIKRSQNAPLRASVKSGTAQRDHTARKKHPKNAPRTTLAIDLFARLTAGACHACCGCR